jgi:hypothetical protein
MPPRMTPEGRKSAVFSSGVEELILVLSAPVRVGAHRPRGGARVPFLGA